MKFWEKWWNRTFPDAAVRAATSRTSELTLPIVGHDPKDSFKRGSGSTGWILQTYADFASKTEKKNPSVVFDKKLMDDAFTAAVNKAKRRKGRSTSARDENEILRVSNACYAYVFVLTLVL